MQLTDVEVCLGLVTLLLIVLVVETIVVHECHKHSTSLKSKI
jgi:hypothetical protein